MSVLRWSSVLPPRTGDSGQTVSLTGIASAEALGTPTIVPGGVTITPGSISSAEALGTARVDLGI